MDNTAFATATMLVLEAGDLSAEFLATFTDSGMLPDSLQERLEFVKSALEMQSAMIRLLSEHMMNVGDKLEEIQKKATKD